MTLGLDGMSQGQANFFKTEKEMHALATYLLHKHHRHVILTNMGRNEEVSTKLTVFARNCSIRYFGIIVHCIILIWIVIQENIPIRI